MGSLPAGNIQRSRFRHRPFGRGLTLGALLVATMIRSDAAPGSLDPAFNMFTQFAPDSFDEANALVIDSQGRMVVAGRSNANGTDDFALARYKPDGTLDTSFGQFGLVLTDFGGDDAAVAVGLDIQGRIVVAGQTTARGDGLDFVTARYSANGQLDLTFAGGSTLTDFGNSLEYAKALVIDDQGRIIVAGDAFDGDWDFVLVRLMSDGRQDPTFNGGRVRTGLGDSEEAGAMALDASGRIVVAGRASGSIALVRYDTNGILDSTFGQNGAVQDQAHFGDLSAAYAIVIDDLGRIAVAGTRTKIFPDDSRNTDFIVARYHDDGTPDNLFGSGGWISTGFGGLDFARGLAIDTEGRLVAAGSNLGANADFLLARYTPYGSLDETFGQAGRVGTDLGGSDEINAMVLDAEGRIVVAGSSSALGTRDFVVRRYQTRPLADLDITKGASPGVAVAGDRVTYSLRVTNGGPDAATNVSIVNNLPGSLTFLSCSAASGGVCGGTGNTRTVTYSSLGSSAQRNVSLEASVNFDVPDGTVITNTATVNAAAPDDPDTSNNTATTDIRVLNKSDLFLTERVAKLANRQLSYTIDVKNLGPYSARRILMSDPLPNGTKFVSANSSTLSCTLVPGGSVGTLSCTGDALEVGQTASVTLVVKVTAPGSVDILNTPTVSSATFDPNAANNSATLTTRVSGK